MTEQIRFARLGFVHLDCTDLEASAGFYRDLVGLQQEQGASGEVWLRCSDKPYDIVLSPPQTAGLRGCGFEIEDAAQLDAAFGRLTDLGTAPRWLTQEECAARKLARALQFRDPVSDLACVFYAGQQQVDAYRPTHTHIARLGHLVLNVVDLEAAERFWVDALGFAVSDRVGGVAQWLRAWPNPLRHSLALLQSTSNTLHHINFMVTDVDDVGRAVNRMKAADVPIVFGPGRHLPSTSIFLYFLDPDSNTAEYSFGMELFDEHGAREARELEHSAETMDIWGSRPDPRFGKGSPVLALHD